jgi:CO/xanthine dehydrogenase FAD-binding subunit
VDDSRRPAQLLELGLHVVDVALGALLVLDAVVVWAGEHGERSEPRAAGRRGEAAALSM